MAGPLNVENAGQTTDASTLAIFQRDWALYRKMVDNNFLFHREAYGCLRGFLLAEFARPFRFVDIACGDAGASVEALRGTQAIAYRGIDLSAPALQLAARAVERLACPAMLEQSDFLDSVGGRPGSADVIWIGLSLHHLRTPEKQAFMRKVRGDLADGGAFLIYENARLDGEDRESWMRRWDLQRPLWTAYSDEEFAAMTGHVHSADFRSRTRAGDRSARIADFRPCASFTPHPQISFASIASPRERGAGCAKYTRRRG